MLIFFKKRTTTEPLLFLDFLRYLFQGALIRI